MIEGLYGVEFRTGLGGGAGVVHASGGELNGGDSAIYYKGSYEENGSSFSAKVKTGRHSHGMPSVFGIDEVEIHITGTVNGDTIATTGTSPQAPGLKFEAHLKRIA